MTALGLALILLGGFAAGAANAIAGGGTFFSFPALLAVGVPPVVANASNSVALWPGSLTSAWAYRVELARFGRTLWPMALDRAGALAERESRRATRARAA